MGRNLYKLIKFLMTSSKFDSLRIVDFQGFWLNISFKQSHIEVFEIKGLEISHPLLPW